MKVRETELDGVIVIEPTLHRDGRGFFVETFRRGSYEEFGIGADFVQDNLSRSSQGTLRGLHLQHPSDQAKLVWVIEGEVLDVAVDVRVGSPTFGRHVTAVLDGQSMRQLFIPAGFAHGFLVRSESALFAYKCSVEHAPDHAIDIAWNDPRIGVDWGIAEPILSSKDAAAPSLEEVMARLPRFEA